MISLKLMEKYIILPFVCNLTKKMNLRNILLKIISTEEQNMCVKVILHKLLKVNLIHFFKI